MPEIVETYQFNQLAPDGLYQDGLSVLKEIGTQELQEKHFDDSEYTKEVSGMVPSVWGWGGMKIGFKVYRQDNTTKADLTGFIAQLSTTPLTKTMDNFLARLAGKLRARENYSFQYEPLTRFLPRFKLNFTKTDKWLIIIILAVTFVTTLVGLVLGHASEVFISTIVLGLGYYFGRKYLSKKQ